MATKKSSRRNPAINTPALPVPQYEDISGREFESEPNLTEEQENTIAAIAKKFGGDGLQMKVYKVLPGGADQYWYTAPNPNDIDEDKIRTVNGGVGGNFNIKIYVGDEWYKTLPMSIADAPGLLTSTASAGGDPTLNAVLQRLAAMEQSLLARNSTPAEPMSQVISALAQLDQIRGGSQQKEMPMETIMRCIEMGKSLGGGSPVDDSFMGLLRDVLKEATPVLAPMLMSALSARPAAAALPAAQNGGGEVEQAQLIEQRLKDGIVFLKKKCMMGSDPDLYLCLILESADNEEFARLIHIAVKEEFAIFAKLDPEIEQPAYVKFFRHIYDGIRSEVAARNQVDNDSGGAGGDTSDTPANVRIVKGGGR